MERNSFWFGQSDYDDETKEKNIWQLLKQNGKLNNTKEIEHLNIHLADQLDDLYHNGIDGWKETIKSNKRQV